MEASQITSKFQVVIPRNIRERYPLKTRRQSGIYSFRKHLAPGVRASN